VVGDLQRVTLDAERGFQIPVAAHCRVGSWLPPTATWENVGSGDYDVTVLESVSSVMKSGHVIKN